MIHPLLFPLTRARPRHGKHDTKKRDLQCEATAIASGVLLSSFASLLCIVRTGDPLLGVLAAVQWMFVFLSLGFAGVGGSMSKGLSLLLAVVTAVDFGVSTVT